MCESAGFIFYASETTNERKTIILRKQNEEAILVKINRKIQVKRFRLLQPTPKC